MLGHECMRNMHGIMTGMTCRDTNKISRNTPNTEVNLQLTATEINLCAPSVQVQLVFNQSGETDQHFHHSSILYSVTPAAEV